MAISETIKVGGDKLSSSNSGRVTINQTTGEITFRNPTTNQITTKIDADGYHQYRVDGQTELMTLDSSGMTYAEADGTRRVRLGAHPVDGHIVEAITESGVDVISELGG